ncbi:pentapeptide repeat-containing protein [Streptomyces griseoluteus]|uniref:pentapeptide repeat-containing protein n=1 Tax=Streptomyces TaxID=1883 RepID=UPI000A3CCD32|nr:pentapeptide repeat-containing protein [Streptomyces recifensis]
MADHAPATSPRTWWFAAAVLLLIAGFLWLLWKGPWLLDSAHLNKQPTPGVAAVVSGFRTAIVAVGAGIVAGTGLVLSHRTLQHTRENDRVQSELTRGTLEVTGRTLEHAQARDREQAELTREGQVTDRFTNAIRQLASERDVERLGGVYALERIMRDSEKDHPTVVEVLAAFVRYHAPAGREADRPRPVEAVQAALTVLARRPKRAEVFNIDLRGTDLRRADLNTGNLAHVQLSESDLRNANLYDANLYHANLSRSDLRGAVLRDSDMEGAITFQTSLSGTYMAGATGLTSEQILAAFPSDTTELPDDLAANQEVQEWIADLEMEQHARAAREATAEHPTSDGEQSDPPSA